VQLKTKSLEVVILAALFVWGTISLFQGAGLSFFVSGAHQFRDELFIETLYCSVIGVSVFGLFHARAAAFMSMAVGIVLLIWLFATNGLAHGVIVTESLIWAVVSRPILAGLLLFLLPPVGPVGRRFMAQRARNK